MENNKVEKIWNQLHPNKVNELMRMAGAQFEMMNWVDYEDFDYEKYSKLLVVECIKLSNE